MSARDVTVGEWQSASPDTDPALIGSYLSSTEARDEARTLTEQGRLRIFELREGLRIEARSHIGRVQLGNLTITVKPKVAPHLMVRLLGYAFGLHHTVRTESLRYAQDDSQLADLLIAQLVDEVEQLVSRGVAQAYVRQDALLDSPRGRIRFAALARRGGMTNVALPCTHHPRSTDTLLNRVVLAGLELALTWSSDTTLRSSVQTLVRRLEPMVAHQDLTWSLLVRAQAHLNRLTYRYAGIIELVRAMYLSQLPALSGPTTPGLRARSFLLDMNHLWQRLLGRFLEENLEVYRVHSESPLETMLTWEAAYNPQNRRNPRLRPDFLVREPSGSTAAVLDAKYRDLWATPLPPHMLYQLAIYAMSQSSSRKAAILYPTTEPASRSARVAVRNPVTRQTIAHVILRPVYLRRLVDILTEHTPAARRARADLAYEFVFDH